MPKPKWSHRSWRTPGTPSRHWRTLAWAMPLTLGRSPTHASDGRAVDPDDYAIRRWVGPPLGSRFDPQRTPPSGRRRVRQ
jgi:hypothetical protein